MSDHSPLVHFTDAAQEAVRAQMPRAGEKLRVRIGISMNRPEGQLPYELALEPYANRAPDDLVPALTRAPDVVWQPDEVGRVWTEEGLTPPVLAGATELGAVMTPNPRTVEADSPFSAALQMMYEGGFRNVPVVENGRPIGLVSTRDALGPELKEFVYEMLRQEQTTDVLA